MPNNPELVAKATASPNATFSIVVVTDAESASVPHITLLEEYEGLDNIWHGTITGHDLLDVLANEHVLSVDEDTEQTALT